MNKKIIIGEVKLKGLFKKKIILSNIDFQKLCLCSFEENLSLLPTEKKGIYQLEGTMKPETVQVLEDLNFDKTFNVLKLASKLKKELDIDNSDTEKQNSFVTQFLISLLNATEYLLRNRNPQVLSYYLQKNKSIDLNVKNTLLVYLNEIQKLI